MGLVSEHTNVYRSCIGLLSRKGWKITIFSGPYEQEDVWQYSYQAEKDGTEIRADNPVSLLGLTSIHEYHYPYEDKPYWWAIEEPDLGLYDRLKDEALERSFFEYLEKQPEVVKELVRKAMKESESDPGTTPEDRLGISRESLLKLLDTWKNE